MSEARTRAGGCHCGRVRFEVTGELGQVVSCNCSICTKRGLLLVFVPVERFALLSGQDRLADYQFGRRRVHHLFCTECGVESFGRGTAPDGSEMVAVNVRCLDGVDLGAITPIPFNGRDL